ncbi:MAG: aspartyl protease family protein [Sphingomonas sp.]
MRLLVLLWLLIGASPVAARPEQSGLAADTEARWVPFTLNDANQIRFIAVLNGRPVTAILDTGVSHSVLSRPLASRLHLRIAPGATADAIGGGLPIGWIESPPLAFGGFDRRGGRLAVATLPDSATGGDPVDLLVGRDLLAPFALEIDYDGGVFRLLPSGRIPFRGIDLPLMIGGDAPSYLSDVPVNGAPSRLIVDTGDGNAITLSTAAWRRIGGAARTTTTLSYGVGGSAVTELAILPSLALGALHAGATQIAIEREGGYSQGAGASGRIGTGFLRRYHILLDPAARHMILTPGQRAEASPPRSTTGLLVAHDGGVLRVLHVMRGSPAADDGWQTGDTICAVDGVLVADRPPDAAEHWPIAAPGTMISLMRCGGTARTLMSRAFY